jgi:hypothetical protein
VNITAQILYIFKRWILFKGRNVPCCSIPGKAKPQRCIIVPIIAPRREGLAMQSIMPEGGWIDPPQQDTQQRPDYPPQPSYTPRSSYLTCKICDRGTLSLKTVFRMSGPAVAIGFILLIPSILGMIFSALMFLGVNALTGGEASTISNESERPFQSALDFNFRRNCANGFSKENPSITHSEIEQICECKLSAYKETGLETIDAAQTCVQETINGTLDKPSRDVDALYFSNTSHQSPDSAGSNLFRVAGSGFAIALGIASFVGGLLGWLLVMRRGCKRLLETTTTAGFY